MRNSKAKLARSPRPSERRSDRSDRYFIVPPGSPKDGAIVLDGPEFHHCVRVSRVRRGEAVKLLDGQGGTYEARLERIGAREARLEVISYHASEAPVPVDIALGIIKAPRLDLAIEKCTELGVRRLIPFTCARSVWRGDAAGSRRAVERMRRKIVSSCKQSGQPFFPVIDSLVDLEGLQSVLPAYAASYLADQHFPGGPTAVPRAGEGPVLGIVGPEGGLTSEECERLLGGGAVPVSLGPFRLRSETAAICLAFGLLSGRYCAASE